MTRLVPALGQLKRCCAGSTPSPAIVSTASAAREISASTSLLRLEPRQHVVRDRSPVAAARPPDADSQPQEVLRAERLRDRAQPVVAGEPAAAPRLQPPRLEVDVVVHDEQRSGSTLKNLCAAETDVPDTFMYVSGLSSASRSPSSANLGQLPVELRPERAAVPARELVDRPSSPRCAACARTRARDCRAPRRAGRASRPPRPAAGTGARASPRSALRRRPRPRRPRPRRPLALGGLFALRHLALGQLALFELLFLGLGSTITVGARHGRENGLLGIVEERDALGRAAGRRGAACRRSPSRSRRARGAPESRAAAPRRVISRCTCESTPPSFTPADSPTRSTDDRSPGSAGRAAPRAGRCARGVPLGTPAGSP